MLIAKLAVVCAIGAALGVYASVPVAFFTTAVVATALTLSQLQREVAELRQQAD